MFRRRLLKTKKYDSNGHEYVDLGLPSGTLWCDRNIGASSPEETGLYFQWGDTQGYTVDQVGTGEGQKAFTWNDYKWGVYNSSDSTNKGMTKYNKTDGKLILDLEDDAAHVNMGGDWRMPTREQFKELFFETTIAITYKSGIIKYGTLNKTSQMFIWGITYSDNINYIHFINKMNSEKSIVIPISYFIYEGKIENSIDSTYLSINSIDKSLNYNNAFNISADYLHNSTNLRAVGMNIRSILK